MIPEDFKLYPDPIMSNFDHEIKPQVAEAIKGEKLYAEYPGWNFYGQIWWDNIWMCDIYRYGTYQKTYTGTLEEIMEEVSEDYGYE